MNKIDEDWRPTYNNSKMCRGETIIAVSNRGRIKRKNGTIEESTLYQRFRINGKLMLIHRFIAEHFLPPPTDEDKKFIDHRTHEPEGMNVNDIMNLRWCTHKENMNFDEAIANKRKPKQTSEFGKKYKEHYGYSYTENPSQYKTEYARYYRNGHCSWE